MQDFFERNMQDFFERNMLDETYLILIVSNLTICD